MTPTQAQLDDAYCQGAEAATAVASWTVDGNTAIEAARRVLTMLREGDPGVWEMLPAWPNLSGEWAGDPTPFTLARDILDCEENAPSEEDQEALADEFERGVGETFESACEAELIRFTS